MRVPGSPQPGIWSTSPTPTATTLEGSGLAFTWQAKDGSEILTHFMPCTYALEFSPSPGAGDADFLRTLHPYARILGNFTGRLARSGELLTLLDAAGNVADEVRYFDGKPWPAAADGGGSSLELRDPRSDNARPESWSASDERQHSAWETHVYSGVARDDGGPRYERRDSPIAPFSYSNCGSWASPG